MALDYNYPFSSPSEGNIENVIIQAFQDPDVTPSLDYCNRFSVKDPRWGATGDGVTDDTNAIMAAVNYCWNNGSVRGSVEVPPGNYKISDTDSDGFGLKIPDGVHFIGHGYASRLFSTTAIKMVQYNGQSGGTWKKGLIRDLRIDGTDVALCGLHLYGGAYYGAANIIAHNCVRPIVIDGSQNILVSNCQGKDGTENFCVLNGAGSVVLDACGTDGAFTRHILLDNDASYPGYALRLSQGGPAYDDPTAIIFRGGVYERTKSGGSLSEVLKIVRGSHTVFENVNFSGSPTNALIEYGASAAMLIMRSCYWYHGSQAVDVAHLLGYNAIVVDVTIAAAAGDIFQVGNYATIQRPNVTVQAGKVLVKHSSGSALTAMQQIRYESIKPGGATAARPGLTEISNATARRFNYDLHVWETYDPNASVWRTEGFYDNAIGTTVSGGGTFTPDLNACRHFVVTASGGNITIAAPTNAQAGDRFAIEVVQDVTGGRTVTWNAAYRILWSDTGNTASKRSTIQIRMANAGVPMMLGAQSPYV